MGRRVKKTVYAYGSGGWQLQKEILFVYDGWNLIHEKEISGTGDPLFDTFYVWGLDLSQSIQGASGIGGLVCRVSGGEVRHYFYDANGNVGQLVNPADGVVTARYEYDPFGNAVFVDGADAEGNVFRFSTKYWDGETKLFYYGYRYYAPEMGRWISRDPVEEVGGINLFKFISNSPLDNFDILGMWKATEESKGKSRRIYIRESDRDKLDDLAFLLQLSFNETTKWAKILSGSKNKPCEVSVPNTGYIDVANYAWGYLTPFLRGYKSGLIRLWENEGLKVVYTAPKNITKPLILDHLKSRNIYKFAYLGHGAYGFMTSLKNPQNRNNNIIVGGKYTRYAIAEFHVIACESFTERKKWAKNVSALGWLRTTKGIITPIHIIISELFGGNYFHDEFGTIP